MTKTELCDREDATEYPSNTTQVAFVNNIVFWAVVPEVICQYPSEIWLFPVSSGLHFLNYKLLPSELGHHGCLTLFLRGKVRNDFWDGF